MHTARLVQIDGLRAIAALVVLGYHYTTRFDEKFMAVEPSGIAVPWGYLGVYLFFAISGFAIFMTLDRCRTPLDFVASRVARLYPAYWVAIAITWLTLQALTVPGYHVSGAQALANLTMFHAFFGVPNVDGVYWSLQVELLFYVWMLAVWSVGLLRHSVAVGFAWVGLALAVAVAEQLLGIALPRSLSRFLVLEHIPWFVIGMTLYLTLRERRWSVPRVVLLTLCVATISIPGEIEITLGAVATIALVLFASRGWLRPLESRPLLFVGAISYPLYLLHEKIGWAVRLQIEPHLPAVWLSIAFAIVCSVALAAALHYLVEDPARLALRHAYARYRKRITHEPGGPWFPRWTIGAAATVAFFLVCNVVTGRLQAGTQETARATSLLLRSTLPTAATQTPCHAASGNSRRLIVVLGQSNAASHAEPGPTDPVTIYRNGACWQVSDPLPGTTGDGASVWSRVAQLARADVPSIDLVLAPLAVQSTQISDWTGTGELNRALRQHLEDLRQGALQNLPVTAVVWQQGEADAQLGTDAAVYRDQLLALRRLLDQYGIAAPMLVGKSTYCGDRASAPLQRAVDAAVALVPGLQAGANTDVLGDGYRDVGRCHFNVRGRSAAAQLWWDALRKTGAK